MSRYTQSHLSQVRYGAAQGKTGQNRLTVWPLTLMTVGGIMGSGLFLASGSAIRLAGPGIVISFAIGATVMALQVSALAEMAAADPERGSFLAFARHALGPGPAFIGGWIFWVSSILNLAAESVAAAIFTRLWFPGVPVYVFSMGYAALIAGINFLPVKNFSHVESVMSLTKIGVTALFIAAGAFVVVHLIPVRAPVGLHLWGLHGGFFPHGVRGVAAAMVLVLFSMSGTGVLGLAAPDVARPERTMGPTIRNTVVLIYVLYVGASLAMTALVPWNHIPNTSESPFIAALRLIPWGPSAAIFNVVILVAVLSAMNAGLFATNRVLATLGRIHDAPGFVGGGKQDVPRAANVATGIGLVVVSGLAYVLPKTAYLYLVTATGFQALFIWLLIVVTELFYRPRLLAEGKSLRFRMWMYPWSGLVAILLILGIIATAPLAPRELVALAIGVGITTTAALAYLPVRRARRLAGGQLAGNSQS
ncbi:MAG: amino acid permease [Clostridia bacterium]